MIRRLLIGFLVLLVALAVIVDRVGARVAGHVLSGKLQTYEHLPTRPVATIGGIPFLTQAFKGDYTDVSVTTGSFTTPDGVPIGSMTAHLHGVHIPFSYVLHGTVKTVPVDSVDGSVTLTLAGIAKYLVAHNVAVALHPASGGRVSVVEQMLIGKHKATVYGIASVSLHGTVLTVQVGDLSVKVPGQRSPIAAPPTQSIPVLTIPLVGLPFRIDVTSVSVTSGGIVGTGTAKGVTLGS